MLSRNRPGHGIEALFQHGDPGIKPVAVAVQRVDGGRQPPRLVLAVPGDGLQPVGLLHQVGCRDLVAPPAERMLVGHDGNHDGCDRRDAPGSETPHRTAVEFVFLGKEAAQHATGVFSVEASQMVGIFGQNLIGPPQGLPN